MTFEIDKAKSPPQSFPTSQPCLWHSAQGLGLTIRGKCLQACLKKHQIHFLKNLVSVCLVKVIKAKTKNVIVWTFLLQIRQIRFSNIWGSETVFVGYIQGVCVHIDEGHVIQGHSVAHWCILIVYGQQSITLWHRRKSDSGDKHYTCY